MELTPDIVVEILSVPFSRQLLDCKTMTWGEAGNAPLLLEPARAHGTRTNERYAGIVTRPIFGWKRYQKFESEDKKSNLDRCDSITKESF